jgi:ABC-type antimicrobial peptide transport system permease subunit
MTTPLPLRHALRSLARTSGFAVGVLATFALGIGGNTAVFSAAWTLLLAPPPLREPQRVVAIRETFEAEPHQPVARFQSDHLYEISPTDPPTLVAAALMLAVSLLAGWLPAQHDLRVDSMAVLRDE